MKRPNILILYTDQQRWDALGANGNKEIITPSLDKLAADGVSFTHHFVQNPVCMPSRISMLSGRYPSSLGITHMGVPVPEDIVTLPHILKQYGYRTANIGKLHFLPHANRDHRLPHPAYGFDHLEIADEPGVYEDAYRAWARRRAPEQMDGVSAGIPPASRVWQRTMGIDDGVVHRGDPEGRHDFDRAIPFAADDGLTHSAFVGEQTMEFIEQAGEEPSCASPVFIRRMRPGSFRKSISIYTTRTRYRCRISPTMSTRSGRSGTGSAILRRAIAARAPRLLRHDQRSRSLCGQDPRQLASDRQAK